ncbi:MAG: LuxR C-terminal-related transcriptional regulator, partial [Rubrobacter sp.]
LAYEAIGHALRAEDFGQAATLIEAAAPPAIGRGEYETLLRWLDALPYELVGSRPRLGLSAAWALTAGGKYEESEARLGELESSAKVAGFAGEIAALHSANLLLHDLPRSITYARLALERLPEHDLFLRGVVAVNLGMGEIIDGDMAAAEHHSAEAAAIADRTGNRFVAVVANNNLAEVRERQGRLREAAELFRRALASASDRAGRPLPMGGAVMACTHLGRVLYKLNDLDGAERYLTQAIRLGERGRTVELLWITYLCMAHLSQTRGDVEAALGWRDRAERIARETNQPYGVALAAASRVWLRLAVGGDEATLRAREYADDLSRTDVAATPLPLLVREIQQLTLARSLIFLGEPDRALPGLAETLRAAETTGRIGTTIEVHVLRAVALHKRGDVGEALAALETALALAEPGGYVRAFVDEGDPMETLHSELLAARRKGPRDARQHALLDYARRLLAAFESPHADTEPPSPPQQETDRALPEPLTPREREVLELISAGLSNGEIAASLFIATSTAKWYVHTIFRKLEVDSRTRAVARARELHLVSE